MESDVVKGLRLIDNLIQRIFDNSFRAEFLQPVSYTHLDVYKRQVRDLIPRLKELGAEGIIEYPLNKVVY